MNPHFLEELDALIAKRKHELPDGSYTSDLFKKGIDRILRKVGEETGEFIIACKNNDPIEIKNEAADLLFHTLVALHARGLSLKEVTEILEERHFKAD